jgi:AbiV family abortive infection protein
MDERVYAVVRMEEGRRLQLMSTSENNAVAIGAVLAHAERLLGDATLLFEHERYATSLALAVLSIEEGGKASILGSSEASQAELRLHKSKQRRLAAELLAAATLKAVDKHRLRFFEHEIEQLSGDTLDTQAMIDLESRWVATANVNNEIRDHVAAAMAAASAGFGIGDAALLDASGGRFDALKMRGFYVDVADDGAVVSDPASITRELAEGMIALAQAGIQELRNPTPEFRMLWEIVADL